jgi:hypothetical protein
MPGSDIEVNGAMQGVALTEENFPPWSPDTLGTLLESFDKTIVIMWPGSWFQKSL